MEEYNLNLMINMKDTFQKFFFSKTKFGKKPVVDIWCLDLLKKSIIFLTLVSNHQKKFIQYCTFDIDNAYAFKNRA